MSFDATIGWFSIHKFPETWKGDRKKHNEKDKNHILSQTTRDSFYYIFSHCFSETSFFLHYYCEEHTL